MMNITKSVVASLVSSGLLIVVFVLWACPVKTDATNASPKPTIGTHVTLAADQQGFLKYQGDHGGVTFYGLSADIGSASPCEDFRLYAGTNNKYRLVLSLPMTPRKGFRCTCVEDRLDVFMTTTWEAPGEPHKSVGGDAPVLSINLLTLSQTYAEPTNMTPKAIVQNWLTAEKLEGNPGGFLSLRGPLGGWVQSPDYRLTGRVSEVLAWANIQSIQVLDGGVIHYRGPGDVEARIKMRLSDSVFLKTIPDGMTLQAGEADAQPSSQVLLRLKDGTSALLSTIGDWEVIEHNMRFGLILTRRNKP